MRRAARTSVLGSLCRTSVAACGRCASSKSTAAASSSPLKGQRLRFRVVEKPGQVVGLSDPLQRPPPPYPFRVTALKTSQTVYVERADLADVLSVFQGTDAEGICHVLKAEFQMCAETLRPRGADANFLSLLGAAGVSSAAPMGTAVESRAARKEQSALAAQQVAEISGLHARLEAFDTRLDSCASSLGKVQALASCLPEMHNALQTIITAYGGTPPRPPPNLSFVPSRKGSAESILFEGDDERQSEPDGFSGVTV